MFGNKDKKDLNDEIDTLKAAKKALEREKLSLTEEVAQLKLKKKIEDEDIKHMVKLKEERQEVECQKKELTMEKEKSDAIAEIKDQYRDKTEGQLEKRGTEIKEMYGEILARLPNINVGLGGKTTKK